LVPSELIKQDAIQMKVSNGMAAGIPAGSGPGLVEFHTHQGLELRQPTPSGQAGPAPARGPGSGKKIAAVAAALLLTVAMLGLYYFNPWAARKDTGSKHYATGELPETIAEIQTSMGTIVVVLRHSGVQATVNNFLSLASSDFYNRTIFHRVINGSFIQGGGYLADLSLKNSTLPKIKLETTGIKNLRGTIAMARGTDPDSATSQFFINVKDNPAYDPSGTNPGYAVFGSVTNGMDVVDAIANVNTTTSGDMNYVPVVPVVIDHIVVLERG